MTLTRNTEMTHTKKVVLAVYSWTAIYEPKAVPRTREASVGNKK